ncbi:hypothetical protein BDZ85DRAFT_41258 [Elsinoe ampelina]|uniref:Uncharacterized protein n=1 Tax=Elsinoe ampelina TaxID=302913 RepID=A0A6A6G265_9PEZI|nr:hypothetical protein BDZ85DRAFT_41258 [Elsinoe ampelina]
MTDNSANASLSDHTSLYSMSAPTATGASDQGDQMHALMEQSVERDAETADTATPFLVGNGPFVFSKHAECTVKETKASECESKTASEQESKKMIVMSMSRWDRLRYWANQHWFYETLACFVSAASLTGVIVLLLVYDGKPTPEWPRVITINSAIAVLTTVMKGTMIFAVSEGLSQIKWTAFMQPRLLSDLSAFDSASRGPWGAFLFLLRRQASTIALLGAIITVLAMAVDPFAQQVVAYRPCEANDTSSPSTIQKIQVFDLPPEAYLSRAGNTGTKYGNSLEQAILTNLINFDAPIQPLLQTECATGNCTFWGDEGYYATLAIGHECEDISERIRNTTHLARTATGDGSFSYEQTTVNYSLPAFDSFSQHVLKELISLSVVGYAFEYTDPAFFSFSTLMYTSTDYGHLMAPSTRPIFRFAIAAECRFSPIMKIMNARSRHGITEGVEVHRKSLFLVQRTYNTSIAGTGSSNSAINEWYPSTITSDMISLDPTNIIESYPIGEMQFTTKDWPSERSGDFHGATATGSILTEPSGLPSEVNNAKLGDESSIKRRSRATVPLSLRPESRPLTKRSGISAQEYVLESKQFVYNGELLECTSSGEFGGNNTFHHKSMSNHTAFYDPRCFFFMSEGSMSLLGRTLSSLFTPRAPGVRTVWAHDYDPPVEIERTPDNLHMVPLLNDGAASMDSINHYASRIADTLSNYITVTANMSFPGNEPVIGTTVVVKTCASVTWGWLVLPAILTVSTISFLLLVIWKSKQDGLKENWPGMLKSSPLGLLLYESADDQSFVRYDGPNDAVAMECVADCIRTRLRRRDELLREDMVETASGN